MASRWREALAGYGLTPETAPAEAAFRIARSLLRDRLLTALDLWLLAEPSAGLRESTATTLGSDRTIPRPR